MARRTSVYFAPPLEALISDLKTGASVSGRINRCAERYQEIVKRSGLVLIDEERDLLVKLLSRSTVHPVFIFHLAGEFQYSALYDESYVANDLLDKLRKASFSDLVATVEKLGF